MTKIISLVILSVMMVSMQCTFAKHKDTIAQPSNTIPEESIENFDFSENSYNISNEQADTNETSEQIEDKTNFDSKVINSSHFSSSTATRTWIPLNRFK